MGLTAGEVMDTRFFTLKPETPIGEAVHVFREADQESGRTVFGLMVTDDEGKLVGMLSVYDIFLLLRPKTYPYLGGDGEPGGHRHPGGGLPGWQHERDIRHDRWIAMPGKASCMRWRTTAQ